MTITQEIIDNSKRGCDSKCALASAYNELVPHVLVRNGIHFYNNLDQHIASVSFTEDQPQFIRDFDSGNKVNPQTFEVEIPDSVIEYWYQSHAEAAAKIANSKILELI